MSPTAPKAPLTSCILALEQSLTESPGSKPIGKHSIYIYKHSKRYNLSQLATQTGATALEITVSYYDVVKDDTLARS